MADPTNAQQRTMNSFFDAPRFPIKALPPIPDEPVAEPPAATPTPTPAPTAPTVAPAPVPLALKVAITPAAKRTVKTFLRDGLAVRVTADRAVADIEARLFELLPGGTLRPLGSAFRVEPGTDGAHLRIEPTRFARGKLAKGRGARNVQLHVSATDRNGLTGSLRSSFKLR